ncbi:hypothetical protein [Aeromonas sp. R5-1]|uniref:hypothetical protein n=1 Tax=Aeromonas sp. R5-1 TaxID=3138467 RepID=UPI0034A25B60
MITQLTPADGWYFKHQKDSGVLAIYRVAAWGINEQGGVVGLISRDFTMKGPTLRPIQPEDTGVYVHETSLLEAELRIPAKLNSHSGQREHPDP